MKPINGALSLITTGSVLEMMSPWPYKLLLNHKLQSVQKETINSQPAWPILRIVKIFKNMQ